MIEPRHVWQASPKQREFLAADEPEVLFGGAAGGGKSDALIIDALGLAQGAIEVSTYSAIIFRRTYAELEQLIERSAALYTQISPGAKFNETHKTWTFPSGAKIRYRYLERPADRFRYQGSEFQYIAFDELTQHPTDVGYEYMQSRLRSGTNRLNLYVRATCNPGGFGHEWVRDRWLIPDDGQASTNVIDMDGEPWTRRFIPSRISDNAYLAGTGYEKRLKMLPEMERKALLEGRWDVIEVVGAIYGDEIAQMYEDGRICGVPIEPRLPVYTFWDLGRSDATAAWMMQSVGMERRLIGYKEDRFKSISWWAKEMREWAKVKRIGYADHYMPHDVEVRQLSLNNASRKEMFEEAGISPIQVVPRVQFIEDGIDVTREFLATCWIDRQGCADGLKALANYRREYNEGQDVYSQKPLHNWASNGSDALRQAAQGFVPPERYRFEKGSYEPEAFEEVY